MEVRELKKIAIAAWLAACLLALCACSQQPQQGDNMQYFFSGKVTEVGTESLQIAVNDVGNSNLAEGTTVEVSTDVLAADGCPDLAVGAYAKVLMARSVKDDPPGCLEALAIYEVDEAGAVVGD